MGADLQAGVATRSVAQAGRRDFPGVPHGRLSSSMNRILISVMFLVALVGAGVIYQRGEGKGVVDWAIAAVTETEHRVAALLSAQTKEAGPAAARPQPSIPVVATAVIRKPAA